MLDSVSQGVAVYDDQLRLTMWSKGFLDIHNLEPASLHRSMHMSDIMRIFAERGEYGDGDVEAIVAERMARVPQGQELQEHCYERKMADGSIVEVHGKPLPGGGLLTTYSDLTARHEAIADAQRRALHDPLTGLPNRAKFHENLEMAIFHARRNGTRLALLLLDLDHFKDINDTLGHPAGDMLLIGAAERLTACARRTDTVARLGGDEFAVIGTDIMEEDGHVQLARRILDSIGQPFMISDAPIASGASIGIALLPLTSAVAADELISNADVALYDAKATGRHTYRVFDGKMKKVVNERRALESDLRRALDEDAFSLYFQPQIDLIRNRIIGAEALIRWPHPERGMVPPSVFIPLVERVRLIDPLTSVVLRKACEHLVDFNDAGHGDISVAVNASGLSLRSRTLVDLIKDALDETGARHSQLEVEIMEGALVNSAKGLSMLQELSELGVGAALDDFGAGYSSLSRMRDLPITKLKIDRSFVCDAVKDQRSAAMMQSMIEMGVRLGLAVVCEGVETDEQLALLRSIGCPGGQGYLLGMPMSAENFLARLNEMNTAAAPVTGPNRTAA